MNFPDNLQPRGGGASGVVTTRQRITIEVIRSSTTRLRKKWKKRKKRKMKIMFRIKVTLRPRLRKRPSCPKFWKRLITFYAVPVLKPSILDPDEMLTRKLKFHTKKMLLHYEFQCLNLEFVR